VLEIEHRVTIRAGSSSRLETLRLQAERGMPVEVALAAQGSLTDYGYEFDGSAPRKSLPELDETTERLRREYNAALHDHPQDILLLLNQGQFLLGQNRFPQAVQCFRTVLQEEPHNVWAQLGLGLTLFELSKFEESLAQFEAVVRSDPQNVQGHLNAAICLKRLGRAGEARPHWRRVAELTPDPDLRKRVEWQLSARNP
jgi:tetratricopeptide (TPR) repeat protein